MRLCRWVVGVAVLVLVGCSSKAKRERPLCNPPLCRASCDAETVYGSCDPMSCPPGTAMLVCLPEVSLIACACDRRRLEIDGDGVVTRMVQGDGGAAVTTSTRLETGVFQSLATQASIVAGQAHATVAAGPRCQLTVVSAGQRVEWEVPWPEVHGAEQRPFVQQLVALLPPE